MWTPNDAYGTIIPDLKIDGKPAPYPVVNDRAVRAGAGVMLVLGLFSLVYVAVLKNFWFLNYVVPIFFVEFLLRVVIGPNAGIFSQVGNWIVSNQKPEWVGAIQKRFAWEIGLGMAGLMFIVANVLRIRGPLPLLICGTCLFFMWLESACGICVGCKIYSKLLDWNVLPEPKIRPACPGGVCSLDHSPAKK